MRRLLQQFFMLLLVLTAATGAAKADNTQVTASDGVSDGDIIYISTVSDGNSRIFAGMSQSELPSLNTANALFRVVYVSNETVSITGKNETTAVSYHQFYLQCVADGRYVPRATGNIKASYKGRKLVLDKADAAIFTLQAGTVNQSNAATGSIRLRTTDWNGNQVFLRPYLYDYHNGTANGTLLYVYKYGDAENLVSITFNIKKDGETVHSYTGMFMADEEYTLSAPGGFSELSNNTGTASSSMNGTTQEVTMTCSYPFTISQNTDNATWYFLTIGGGSKTSDNPTGVIHDNGSETYISLSERTFSEENKGDLWCFVGDDNPYKGYKIYNGNSNKVLGCGYCMQGKTGAHNLPILYDESSKQDSISIRWDVMDSGDSGEMPNGFTLAIHETTNCMNSRNSSDTGTGSQALAFWTGGTTAGSTFQVSQKIPELMLKPANDGQSYSTLYLPYEAKVGDGATAYYGTASEGKVSMTPFENNIIPANQGALLVSTTGASSVSLTLSNTNAALSATNSLDGTCTALSDISKTDYYVFGQYESVVGFYRPNITTLLANRAFIKDSNTYNSSNALRMTFNDETTTAISTATSEATENSTTLYDLSGRTVSKPTQSGVYIRGGKKVYIK